MNQSDLRPLSFLFALVVGVACGGDDGDGVTSFGSATGGTTTGPTTGGGPTSADDGGPGSSGGAMGSSGGGAGSTGTDGGPGATTSGSTGPSGSSGGAATDTGASGPFGECIGTGAWQSCAQYCNALTRSCLEAGCEGATVVYYGDIGDCTAMIDGDPQSHACADDFSMGGGISFARCCCG